MTTINDIMDFTESFAPLCTAADFDNCGLLVGSKDTEVSRVMLSLDITADVIAEAAQVGCQLIISHHPVIFNPLRSVCAESPVYLLAHNSLSALCLHTNLDVAYDTGVNVCLAKRLGLENTRLYREDFILVGTLKDEMSVRDFAEYVKDSLGSHHIEFTDSDRSVRTVALCSGAGGEYCGLAKVLGADIFLTGEAKHHEFLEAKALDIPMLTAGHFYTEDVVIKPLTDKLGLQFPDVRFIISESGKCVTSCV